MAIFNLFSKRQKKLRGEIPDVYQYDQINETFRVQVVHIIRDTFGTDNYGSDKSSQSFKFIHETLCKEYGVFTLNKNSHSDFESVYDYFLKIDDHEKALDVIELSFQLINTYVRKNNYQYHTENRKISPGEAITELNDRFKEHGIGYQFEANELIRVDSQFLHSEVVKPVLILLGKEKRFKGANQEYLSAHSHFRHARYKECLVDALKSFESTMKAICHKQGWNYNQNDTAKKLINICFQNNLIPTYLQSQFSSLRSLLESGVPTVRNKLGGHGQGAIPITVTETIASYALHLSASNIVFLVKLETENFS